MVKILIIFLVLLAIALFLNWSNKAIVTTDYEIGSKTLPEDFDGFRIIQISDLQSGTFGDNQKGLLQKVRQCRPDIIVITGDLVDRNHTDYEASLKAAKGLVGIAPVYYTNGNHELALPVDEIAKFYDDLSSMGITILLDRVADIKGQKGQSIHLVGLSEERLYDSKADVTKRDSDYDGTLIEEAVKNLMRGVPEEEFAIMLAHEPQYFGEYAGHGVDLIFAGHAHGGQIRLPFTEGLYAPGQGVLPKLTSGVHQKDGATMVISRGLGNSVFPFRVFNRPEVVVVTLRGE